MKPIFGIFFTLVFIFSQNIRSMDSLPKIVIDFSPSENYAYDSTKRESSGERALKIENNIEVKLNLSEVYTKLPKINSVNLIRDDNEENFKIIQFHNSSNNEFSNFSTGKWAFTFIFKPYATILFDADDEGWDDLVDYFIEQFSETQDLTTKELLASLINMINDNFQEVTEYLYCRNDECVCRHFSAAALPIVSKLLNKIANFTGSIGAAVIWGSGSHESHVYNIVKISKQNATELWFVDFTNKYLYNLSESSSEFLELYRIRLNKLQKIDNPDEDVRSWIKYSIENVFKNNLPAYLNMSSTTHTKKDDRS